MQTNHKSFTITETGLVLDPMYPFMKVSPDGLVNCTCCGSGVIEIKCPYTCKDIEFYEVLNEHPNFFLYEDDHGSLKLKEKHQYYYQVQMQIKVCDVGYCDFVVWKREPFNCAKNSSRPQLHH